MGKKIIVSLLLVLTSATAYGAEKDGFWDKLQYKLEKVTPAKKAASTTAVGGVRGAKNDDATEIYWKGKDKGSDMNEEEFNKFNLAVESKIRGDNELAMKQFEEFLAAYPQSPFRVEGLQAVEKIRQEIAAAKNPPKTEEVAAPATKISAPTAEAAPATEPVVPSKETAPPKDAAPSSSIPAPVAREAVAEPVK